VEIAAPMEVVPAPAAVRLFSRVVPPTAPPKLATPVALMLIEWAPFTVDEKVMLPADPSSRSLARVTGLKKD